MNMRYYSLAVLLILSCLVPGCQVGPDTLESDILTPNPPTFTSIAASPTIPTLTAGATDIPATTIMPSDSPTETAVPTPTYIYPDLPLETKLVFQCLTVQPEWIPALGGEGTMVFRRDIPIDQNHVESRIVFMDLSTGQYLVDEPGFSPHVSNSQQYVAFSQSEIDNQGEVIRDELVVSDARGDHIVQIPWSEEWIAVEGWVEDDRLSIYGPRLSPGGGSLEPLTRLIYNPFTGETELLEPELIGSIPDPGPWGGVTYNPQLTQAAYFHYIGGDKELFSQGLWDVESGQIMVSFSEIFSTFTVYNDVYLVPVWALDGSKVAFVNKMPAEDDTDLYIASTKGKIEQITHLGPYFYLRDSLSWSPDGSRIATFISPDYQSKGGQLAVINTETGEVTNYCLQAPSELPYALFPNPPIWSPDGKQLVFDIETYEEDPNFPLVYNLKSVQAILVDLEKEIAVQIAEDMIPVGWLANP